MCIEAYAAALLDGEGHIGISVPHGNGLVVRFVMADRQPLELLAGKWGGNVLFCTQTSKGRLIYQWQISGHWALEFLQDVKLWVCGKSEQVELALTYPIFPERGRGCKLPTEVVEARQKIRYGLRELRAVK